MFILKGRQGVKHPWDQQKGESAQAFAAFTHYRDMGGTHAGGSVSRAHPERGQARNRTMGEKWYRDWHWKERALAWDAEQDRIRQHATTKAIARATEKAVYKHEITQQRVLEETANVAFSRITDVIQWSGVDGLVDSKDLPDDVAAAIESIEITRDEDGKVKHKVKFHNKMPAITKLGEHKRLWGPKEDSGTNQSFFAISLDGIRSGELQREIERRGILPAPTAVEDKGRA